jgi:hypothetical protein
MYRRRPGLTSSSLESVACDPGSDSVRGTCKSAPSSESDSNVVTEKSGSDDASNNSVVSRVRQCVAGYCMKVSGGATCSWWEDTHFCQDFFS